MGDRTTLRAHCRAILEQGSLEAKLSTPPGGAGALCDDEPGAPLDHEQPAREDTLRFRKETAPLPRPGALRDPEARATCLARFAHHELMAVELFAWALLRWPTLDPALRRGLAHILDEEQLHCRLYLRRLTAHGSALGEHALSGYFWRQLPPIRCVADGLVAGARVADGPVADGPVAAGRAAEARPSAGPAAFLAAMGLTLEQANLDFTLVYRDAFREAGDLASSRVCQRVHDDEIRHVRHAAEWLRRMHPQGDDRQRYEASVPFPLSAARAKGRRFDAAARRRAGLDEYLIEHVRAARSSQELAARGRPR